MIRSSATASIDLDDQAGFAAAIEPLLPMAFRLAYGMLRQPDDAEDVVQEAAFQAWRRRQTFRAGAELRPWFLAIVANQCRMARRRSPWKLDERVRSEVGEPTGAGPDVDQVAGLRRALANLDAPSRLVLVLRFYLDLPYEEVARMLGVSAPAARVRVHRALRKLRPVIEVAEDPSYE